MLFNIFNNKKNKEENIENIENIDVYSFNNDELNELNQKDIEKIKKLKSYSIDLEITKDNNKKKITIEEALNESLNKIKPKEDLQKISYINLTSEQQDMITNSINNINIYEIDNYIEIIKDLLNHNYTLNYYNKANNIIKELRQKYPLVIKYLIGFNNEKNNIINKTTFSEYTDEEWQYLNNYLILLIKIKEIKK